MKIAVAHAISAFRSQPSLPPDTAIPLGVLRISIGPSSDRSSSSILRSLPTAPLREVGVAGTVDLIANSLVTLPLSEAASTSKLELAGKTSRMPFESLQASSG